MCGSFCETKINNPVLENKRKRNSDFRFFLDCIFIQKGRMFMQFYRRWTIVFQKFNFQAAKVELSERKSSTFRTRELNFWKGVVKQLIINSLQNALPEGGYCIYIQNVPSRHRLFFRKNETGFWQEKRKIFCQKMPIMEENHYICGAIQTN